MKSSEKEIIASIFYYLFVIYQGLDINRKVNINKKISPEGSFIINDELLIKIKKNASQKQLKQFENSVGFAIDEISNQEFYSKLLSGSKANFTKTLMAMDYDKKISLFKNTSRMMREDDKGGACSSQQVMAVLIYAVALLGEDHPISNNLKNGAKQLYGFDFESEPQDFEKKIKQWFPEFIDDEELIEGENPFEALAKKYNVDLPSSTPQYELSDEEKNKIPEWFTGPVNNEGSTIKDDKTGKEIKLNGIETSIYELTKMNKMLIEDIGKDIKRGKADKSLLKAPLYETMQNQLDKGKTWLKENKIEAYTVIFGPSFNNPQPNPEEKIKKDPLRKGSWVFEAIDNLESKGVLKKKNNSKKRQKKNVKNNKLEGINYLIFIPVFYIILLSTVTFINPQNSELDNSLDLFLQYHSDLKPFGLIFIGFILWLCIVAIFQNLQNRFIINLPELNLFKFLFYFFVILQILNAFLIINQS